MLTLLLVACAHVAPRLDPDALPVLPPLRADIYTRAPGTPADPLVARVAQGLRWDESLSGAAAAAALEEVSNRSVDTCRLRWMAILAGYPYPLLARLGATVPKGQVPEALVAEARAQAGRAVDVGLARARGDEEDRWVLVVGEHHAELPPLPREVAVGEAVPLGDLDWTVSDPLGESRTVQQELRPDLAGEWMLSAHDAQGTIATFPLYVGVAPPAVPPLKCAAGSGSLEARVGKWIEDLRATYGYASLEHDPALDSVARARLRVLNDGGTVPEVATQLRAAGYVNVPTAGAECRAASVEACLEKVWWAPDRRAVLVGDLVAYGFAVSQADDQVRLVLVGAG